MRKKDRERILRKRDREREREKRIRDEVFIDEKRVKEF